MGFGFSANNVNVIREDKLAGLGLKEYEAFIQWFEDESHEDYDIGEFAREAQYDSLEDLYWEDEYKSEAISLYKALQEAFEEKIGLSINIAFHDSENCGDCYDEVDGVFWSIGGIYVLSDSAKKHSELWEEAYFVTGG